VGWAIADHMHTELVTTAHRRGAGICHDNVGVESLLATYKKNSFHTLLSATSRARL
jgi:hypothetical protein